MLYFSYLLFIELTEHKSLVFESMDTMVMYIVNNKHVYNRHLCTV